MLMRRLTFIMMAIIMLMMASCDKYGDAKQLLADLATAVNNGDKATIQKIYPDAQLADSLAIAFDAKKATFEDLDNGYKVTLSNGVELILTKNNDNGTISVKESHGMFVVPKATLEFARKTGLITNNMNDATIAKQLADTAFVDYVSAEFMKDFKKNFRILRDELCEILINSQYVYAHQVVVKNDCDSDVAGSDYQIVVASTNHRNRSVTIPGEDCFAGSEVELVAINNLEKVFPIEFESVPFYIEDNVKTYIKFTITELELLGKYFTPKGDEYENYLKTKQ